MKPRLATQHSLMSESLDLAPPLPLSPSLSLFLSLPQATRCTLHRTIPRMGQVPQHGPPSRPPVLLPLGNSKIEMHACVVRHAGTPGEGEKKGPKFPNRESAPPVHLAAGNGAANRSRQSRSDVAPPAFCLLVIYWFRGSKKTKREKKERKKKLLAGIGIGCGFHCVLLASFPFPLGVVRHPPLHR